MYGYGYRGTLKKQSGSAYIAEAQALFNEVTDIPETVKPYYNSLISAFVDSGAWADSSFRCIACVPSHNQLDWFIELKSLTRVPPIFSNTGVAYTAPFSSANNRACTKGYNMLGSTQYINTGWIPSDIWDANSHGHIVVTFKDIAIRAQYIAGAFQTPNSTVIGPRFTGNTLVMDSLRISGSGHYAPAVATGAAGVYYLNRQSATDIKILLNGTVVHTAATSGGGLPTIASMLGTYNNAGTPGTKFLDTNPVLYAKIKGVSDANAVAISNAIMTWQENMYYKDGLYDKNLFFDGNSHLVMQWSKQVQYCEVELIASGWDIRNFGVAGQTTVQMSSDAAAQIDVLYNAGYAKNILVAFEVTNDMFFNGVANIQTNYEAYCAARQAAGFSVIACQIMTRTSGGNANGYTQTQYDLATDAFNVWLDANWQNFADAYVTAPAETFVYRSDYASDAAYASAMAALRANTTYFYTDELHLTEEGYRLWGVKQLTAINSL